MPSIEELIAIGVVQMGNPIYIGLVVMILMKYVGRGGLVAIRQLITGQGEDDWPAKNVVINAVTLLLTLSIAVGFAMAAGNPIEEALLRGAISLPIAIGEYELVKNILGTLGYKWH